MKPTILHFADLHLDPATRENTEFAMHQILRVAREVQPALIVNAGDLAMRRGHIAPWVSLELRRFHVELAQVAPVVVVAGNHDLVNSADEAGTVAGALALSSEVENLIHAEQPGVQLIETVEGPIAVGLLPYPSRQRLLAGRDLPPGDVNAVASELLADVARSLGAQAAALAGKLPPVLVYHGSLNGAMAGSETSMTTELDIVLDLDAVPETFRAVLAGHIHKPQIFKGMAAYPGSPCPLNFGEEHDHGVIVWTRSVGQWVPEFRRFEPRRRLVSIDVRNAGSCEQACEQFSLEALSRGGLRGARVRALVRVPRRADAGPWIDGVRGEADLHGAAECRVQVERPADERNDSSAPSAEASLPELIAAYAQRTPDVRPYAQELVDLALELDAALAPEARMLQQLGDYRLAALRFSGWKSFSGETHEIRLRDLGRLVVIEGPNASGKSNAIEVESFALWGRTPRGKVALGDLVRKGVQGCWVEATFSAAGERWRVRRTIRVSAKGAGSAELFLFRHSPETKTWEPAAEGTAAETQKKIERLVGPFELYCATRFASQGEIDRLLDLSPSELKDTLQEALGIRVFDFRLALAKQALSIHGARLEAARQALDGLRQRALDRDPAAGAVEQATVDLRRAADDLAAAEARIPEVEREVAEAKAALEQIEAGARRRLEMLGRVQELTCRIDRFARDLDSFALAVRRGEEAAEHLQAHEADRAQLDGMGAAEGAWRAALAEEQGKAAALGALTSERRRWQGEHATRIAEATKSVGRLEATLAAMESRSMLDLSRLTTQGDALLEAAQAKLARLEEGAALISRVPFGEKCVEAQCSLVAAAVRDRDGVEAARQAIAQVAADNERSRVEFEGKAAQERAEAEAAIARSKQNVEDLREKAAAHDREFAEKITGAEADWAAAKAQLDNAAAGFDRNAFTEISARVHGVNALALKQAAADGAAARGRMVELAAARDQAIADRGEAQAALDQLLGEQIGDREGLEARLMSADRERRDLHAQRTRVRQEESEAQRELGRAQARLEAATQSARDLAEAEATLEGGARRVLLLELWVRAVGRDGIPYLLLERAIPALEAHANHFLGTEGLSVEISPMRDLQTGESRAEVHIRYRNGFGLHPLAAASGFERIALGYALRAALAQVQAEAHGVQVSHWIADEGWGAFDETNLLLGQQMLQRLAERFSRVLFVSHVGPIREVADTRLRVVPDHVGGSRLERVDALVELTV